MPAAEQFDVLVLGTGQGGKLLAWEMAKAGKRTVAVERRWIGGSCPNIACLPSKNEIWSAEVAHLAREAKRYGSATGPVTTDMAAVRRRKRDMVEREVAAHFENFKATGAELIMGAGRFSGPKTLEVALNDGGTRSLTADRVFVNIGTHATIPDAPGLKAARPLTHIEALELDRLPSRLVVLGAGYVGLEFAQAFRRFGSAVTVVESGPQPMAREDPDVATEIQRILSDEGVEFIAPGELLNVAGRSGEQVTLTVRTGSQERRIEASDILVAAGRTPNTAGVGLEHAGVQLDNRGYIRVNDRLETTAPGVWALGECAGSPQFTHISVDDFRIVHANLNGGHRSRQDRLTPYCMFTDPPLARIGLSESEAKRQGVSVRVASLPMSAVLRTHTTGQTQGFMKALIGEDDRILGFAMIGSDAGEVLAAVQMAMLGGLPYSVVRDAVITHPTIAEGLGPLFVNTPARTLH
jgi:pyruvate/2-oxoglutarate dehydrogenase complex dihydrolipoamide dehydrogenase (E3) component